MKKYQNRLMVISGFFIFLLLYLFYDPLAQEQSQAYTLVKYGVMILFPLLACGGYNLWQYLATKTTETSKKDTSEFFEE